MIIVGGAISAQDYQYLSDAVAVAIFGPAKKTGEAAIKTLKILIEALQLHTRFYQDYSKKQSFRDPYNINRKAGVFFQEVQSY